VSRPRFWRIGGPPFYHLVYWGPLEVGEVQTPETLVGESPSDYR
jgi:hypothetical protein